MIGAIIGLASGLTKLGSKFVLDKDKQAEYAFKTQEWMFKLMEKAIDQPGSTWVNNIIKLSIGLMPLWRPVGSFVLAGIGIYCKYKGIDLGEYIEEGMISSPLLWGIAREADKKRKAKGPEPFDPFNIN